MELWSCGVMELWSYGVVELWSYRVKLRVGDWYQIGTDKFEGLLFGPIGRAPRSARPEYRLVVF
jgi:hypothetical protein